MLLDIIDLCDSHAFDVIKNATSRSDAERGSVSLQIRDLRRGASGLMSRKESAKANVRNPYYYPLTHSCLLTHSLTHSVTAE